MKTEVPLYLQLNAKRTQGEWEVSQLCECSLITGEIPNHTDILTSDPNDTIKLFDKLPDNEEWRKANAQYAALAVNNLHILAEALKDLHWACMMDSDIPTNWWQKHKETVAKAKEVLTRIS